MLCVINGLVATRIRENPAHRSFPYRRQTFRGAGLATSFDGYREQGILTAEHALHVLEIILQATESSDEGCAIEC
jgi:hypothetical protein